MRPHKRILKFIAKSYSIDPDELAIVLWTTAPERFGYLKNENSLVKNKDYIFVKQTALRRRNNRNVQDNVSKASKKVEVIYRDHDFSSIGKAVDAGAYLDKEEVLRIYGELVEDFSEYEDPIQPAGVKDQSLLESAIFHPRTSYEAKLKYPTAESAAAALMYALSHNHAFYNGNKRTAMVSMLVFLDKHHIILTCGEDDLFQISIKLADHKLVPENRLYADAEIYELARWIDSNSKAVTHGERPITLKKLRQVLTHFGCVILDNGRVQRVVQKQSLLGPRQIALTSKRAISPAISEGYEIDKRLIKSIREDLELDAVHGLDSDSFYEKAQLTSRDFITKYQVLLRRLSRV